MTPASELTFGCSANVDAVLLAKLVATVDQVSGGRGRRADAVLRGGIGFMMELDLHLWFRRVSAWAMRLGTSDDHRARIARALIDHPGTVVLGQPVPVGVAGTTSSRKRSSSSARASH